MKNKTLSYLSVMVLFISLSAAVLADAEISITPEETDSTKDETFSISVSIDSADDVFGAELDIIFDDNLCRLPVHF